MVTDAVSRFIRRTCAAIVRYADEGRPQIAIVTPLITQPGEQSDGPIPVFDLTSHVVDDNTVVRSDGSAGDPLHASRYAHGLWRIAWSDGRLGVSPDAQSELIHAQAVLTRQTRLARVSAELQNAQATENFRDADCQQAKNAWEQAKNEHDSVSAQQRREPAGFSRLLAAVYFVFAGAILIADLPLSLLVAEALGVELPIPDGNPHDLLVLLKNWSTSWEAIAVSVGVAALTIAFKLIIDQLYIRDEVNEDRRLRLRPILRVTSLLFATATTVYAFYIIGRVRAALAAGRPPEEFDKQYLFTVLAILFPIIAAFCLSMGRLCWQNARRLVLATRVLKKTWERYRVVQQPFEAAKADRISVEARLKAMDDQHIDEMFLRELYTHAFDRGWAVPETRMPNASLYDRCEHLMHRALSRIEQLDNA